MTHLFTVTFSIFAPCVSHHPYISTTIACPCAALRKRYLIEEAHWRPRATSSVHPYRSLFAMQVPAFAVLPAGASSRLQPHPLSSHFSLCTPASRRLSSSPSHYPSPSRLLPRCTLSDGDTSSSTPTTAPTPTPPPAPSAPQRVHRTFQWRGYDINYLSTTSLSPTAAPDSESATIPLRPVLFVHGFGASLNHWRKNISALRSREYDLSANYQVYAIDLIGFGASSKPSPTSVTYSIDLWTELVIDFIKWHTFTQTPPVDVDIDTNFKLQPQWNLIGNSIGSLICLNVTNRLGKDYIRSNILMNCAGGMVSFRYSELSIPQRIVFFLFNTILFNPVVGSWLFRYIRQSENLKKVLEQIYIDKQAISDELLDILSMPAFDEGACQVFLAILTGDAGPNPEDLLKKMQFCPTLALWGMSDPWTPLVEGKFLSFSPCYTLLNLSLPV